MSFFLSQGPLSTVPERGKMTWSWRLFQATAWWEFLACSTGRRHPDRSQWSAWVEEAELESRNATAASVLKIENQALECSPGREGVLQRSVGASLNIFREILISTCVWGSSPRWGKSHLKGIRWTIPRAHRTMNISYSYKPEWEILVIHKGIALGVK